jgi:hypothetical protein
MFPLWPLSPIALYILYVIPSTALCPLYGPLALYGPLSSLWPLFSPMFPSTIFCTIYVPMSPLWSSAPYGPLLPRRRSVLPLRPSILSTALSSLWPSVSSTALCPLFNPYPLYGPLSPLSPSVLSMLSVLSTALCLLYSSFPLYVYLSPLGPSVLSTAVCLFYSPLSPLWSSLPSTALCPLYGPLSPLKNSETSETTLLFSRNVLQNVFRQNSKGYRDLFRRSDNRDYRDNHDYHSSEILSDNREIGIIALAKKVALIAIITSNKKR